MTGLLRQKVRPNRFRFPEVHGFGLCPCVQHARAVAKVEGLMIPRGGRSLFPTVLEPLKDVLFREGYKSQRGMR